MEKQFFFDKVIWHTRVQGNPESREQIYLRFKHLFVFLQDKGLLAVSKPDTVEAINDETGLHSSDLTAKGFDLLMKTYHKWLLGLERGKSSDDMKIFERQLAKM